METKSVRAIVTIALIAASLVLIPGQTASAAPTPREVISAGGYHSCALSLGSVRCWGNGSKGGLGTGDSTDRVIPTSVVDLPSGITEVTTGFFHTCALTSGGAVWCWGLNFDGQLGLGNFVNRYTPQPVNGLGSGVVEVSAGDSHTCALLSDSSVKCWGANESGELGDGTDVRRVNPVSVDGLPTVVSISSGGSHTCALIRNGGVRCWGANESGELGDGTRTDRKTPVAVSGVSGAVQISAGGSHTCIVNGKSGIKCWGSNRWGQLGNGSNIDRTTPVSVSGLTSGAMNVSLGTFHSCAVTLSNGARCWGRGEFGQLGDGTLVSHSGPQKVLGLATTTAAISAGGFHTCALTTSGDARCWGYNIAGELGNGTRTTSAAPVKPSPFPFAQPDMLVSKTATGTYVGGGVFNDSGYGQTLQVKIKAGTSVSFFFRLRNEGSVSDSFKLKGSAGASGYNVSYFRGTTDITTAVMDGTFTTVKLVPGASVRYSIRVRLAASVRAGTSRAFAMRATSVADPARLDVAKCLILT